MQGQGGILEVGATKVSVVWERLAFMELDDMTCLQRAGPTS